MKRWAIFGLIAVMVLTWSSTSIAGDRGRGRWEGFAMGLGAVTLYNLFQHGFFLPVVPSHRAYARHVYCSPPVVHRPSGHWEIRRKWIPRTRERAWIPKHREDGYRVRGHHEGRMYPGYCVKRRVWVDDSPYGRTSRVW